MTPLVVVGMGRIGRALADLTPKPTLLSGRAVLSTPDLDDLLGPTQTVVHVAGPAGEAVCLRDPGGAFGLHYLLTERLALWAREQPSRRLILVSTVAPNAGFYGPLKRAAVRLAQRLLMAPEAELADPLTVIEAGHVIGEGMSIHESPGVVAQFIAAAMTGGQIRVPSPEITIRFTPLSDLLQIIGHVASTSAARPPVLSPVSWAIPVRDVAKSVTSIIAVRYQRKPAVIIEDASLRAPSYADPTGEVLPVKPLGETLMTWLRMPEVRLLFRGPSGRVL